LHNDREKPGSQYLGARLFLFPVTRRLAQALSVLFHPLLIPSYVVALLCFGLPQVALRMADDVRWQLLATLVLLTLVVPTSGVLLLVKSGRASSVELQQREQRPVPLLITALGFGAAAATVRLHLPFYDPLVYRLLCGMATAVALALLVTFRWKISAHGIGLGGAVGLLLGLAIRATSGILPWLALSIILATAVGIARLVLHAHTVAQVVAGLVLGLITALVWLL
jgi:membrane-associated phospholipid phosphatase